MAEKQQPGGFVSPSGTGLPSAPPSYQATFGNLPAGIPYAQQPMGFVAPNNAAPYPTASGAPPYYQQVQQTAAPYPNNSQPFYPQGNAGYPTAGGPTTYPPMGGQPPAGMMGSPYPKVCNSLKA